MYTNLFDPWIYWTHSSPDLPPTHWSGSFWVRPESSEFTIDPAGSHSCPVVKLDRSCALINSSRTPVAPLHPLHWSKYFPFLPTWDPGQMTHRSVARPEEPFQHPSSSYPTPSQHVPKKGSCPFSLFQPPTSTAGDVPYITNLHPDII